MKKQPSAKRAQFPAWKKPLNNPGAAPGRAKPGLGAPQAITAMAHKLARVLWHLLKYKQEFDWRTFEKEEARLKKKKLARLQNLAATLNYQLVPHP